MEKAVAAQHPVVNCTQCAEVCIMKKKTKLAGVKTELFNPHLASFRKAQIDTQLGLLSDEHSKTTLPVGINDLLMEKRFNYDPSSSYVPKSRMLGLEEIVKTEKVIKFEEEVRHTLEDVYQETGGAFAMPFRRIIKIPSIKHVSYMNFRVRLLTPEPSQKWREFVHENGLLYPYGGVEFARAKHRATAEGEINTTAAKSGVGENKEFTPQAFVFPATFSSSFKDKNERQPERMESK